jgi:hypothetical protein
MNKRNELSHYMETFDSLTEAKEEGHRLARQGGFPTIYRDLESGYLVLSSKEMPPAMAFPLLKWVGKSPEVFTDPEPEWVPILTPLNSIHSAQEACALFLLLGYRPIIVEYRGCGTFDIFLREGDIPAGGWIVLDSFDDGDILELQPPRTACEDDDYREFEDLADLFY